VKTTCQEDSSARISQEKSSASRSNDLHANNRDHGPLVHRQRSVTAAEEQRRLGTNAE
jgi:hypothetical protein